MPTENKVQDALRGSLSKAQQRMTEDGADVPGDPNATRITERTEVHGGLHTTLGSAYRRLQEDGTQPVVDEPEGDTRSLVEWKLDDACKTPHSTKPRKKKRGKPVTEQDSVLVAAARKRMAEQSTTQKLTEAENSVIDHVLDQRAVADIMGTLRKAGQDDAVKGCSGSVRLLLRQVQARSG